MKILRDYRAGRRGSILTFVCILLIALLAFTALAVDVGYVCFVKADLQAAADAAALAGASGLGVDSSTAIQRATSCALKNKVNGAAVNLQSSDVQLGQWDPTAHLFTPITPSPGVIPNAVRVIPFLSQARGNPVKLFFAGAVGYSTMDVKASATAAFAACDIVVVLDFSSSMCYDSQLQRWKLLGKTAIVENIRQIWQDLGSPTYGNMTFDGVTISPASDSSLMSKLGLNGVPYPSPQGSWSDYFHYVQNDSPYSSREGTPLADTGYLNKYGYLTLINYWQDVWPQANQTQNLWKTREQPVASVKDGLSVFLAYTQQSATDNRVGLVLFNYSDYKATVEVPLTNDFSHIQDTANHRQAAHYDRGTNTAAGLAKAIQELQSHGRTGAYPVIVLLSDGQADMLDNGTYDVGKATSAAVAQAYAAAAAKIPVITIALGVLADTALMQQIASITRPAKPLYFNVPGGHSVDEYRTQLIDVFASLAIQLPLKLVD